MSGNGSAAQVAYARESSPNSRETPDHFLELLQESVEAQHPLRPIRGVRSDFSVQRYTASGRTWAQGSVSHELTPESTGELLELCLGSVSTTGSDPYDHTATPALPGSAFPTGTWQFGWTDDGGTDRVKDVVGAVVSSWEIAFDATGDNAATIQYELLAREIRNDETLVSPTYPTFTRLESVEASLTIGGSAVCIDSGSITGDNMLDAAFKACAADAGKPQIRRNDMPVFRGNFTADFEDFTLYDLAVAGTESALVLTISDSSSAELVITCNVILEQGGTPMISGPGVIKQNIPFVCTPTSTNATAISAVLTNGDANP